MPVALRQGGLRYYFFSNEGQPPEPAHIHVKGGGRMPRSGSNRPYRSPIVMASIRGNFRISCASSRTTAIIS